MIGSAELDRLYFGGGGGSGGTDGDNPDAGGHGGVGGGIIYVASPNINGSGLIVASGGAAPLTPTGETGGGGGGSGGSVVLTARQIDVTSLIVTAVGGAGAPGPSGRPTGGDGGEGRIKTRLDSTGLAVDVECPNDVHIAEHSSVQSVSLVGFRLTNHATVPPTLDYNLTAQGPLALTDKGNPAALSGTTPILDPGATYYPPEAGLVIPEIRDYAEEVVSYHVSSANFTYWEDSCVAVCILDSPVPVFVQSLTATVVEDAVEIAWDIVSDEEVAGLRIHRGVDGPPTGEVVSDGLISADARTYRDKSVSGGKTYEYTLGVMLADGSEVRSQTVTVNTRAYALALNQNHPNPFNPTTTISFVLPERTRAMLTIYDVGGQHVRTLVDEVLGGGLNEATWDGKNARGRRVSSGVYLYRLEAGNQTITKKLTILK